MKKFIISFLIFLLSAVSSFADNYLFINSGYPGNLNESYITHKLVDELYNTDTNFYVLYLNYEINALPIIEKINPDIIFVINYHALETILSYKNYTNYDIIFVVDYLEDYVLENVINKDRVSGIILDYNHFEFADILNKCNFNINKILIFLDDEKYTNLFEKYKQKYQIDFKYHKFIGDFYYDFLNNFSNYDLIYIYYTKGLSNRNFKYSNITPCYLFNKYYYFINNVLISNPNSNKFHHSNAVTLINKIELIKNILELVNYIKYQRIFSIKKINISYNYFSFEAVYFQKNSLSKIKCVKSHVYKNN